MRRFGVCVTVTVAMLALASPVFADFALDSPQAPVRALFFYHIIGPEYGRRTVWHPRAMLLEAVFLDSMFEATGEQIRATFDPTEEKLAKFAAVLDEQLGVDVSRHPDHPDWAITRTVFAPDGSQDDVLVLAVALHGREWRILALIDPDDPDPWAVFARLDTPAD